MYLVIVLALNLDLASSTLQRQAPMHGEVLFPEASVEGFVLRVADWFVGTREADLHTILVRSFVERRRNELMLTVCLDMARKRTMLCKPAQRGDNVLAKQCPIGFTHQAFSRVVVRNCELAQALIVKQRATKSLFRISLITPAISSRRREGFRAFLTTRLAARSS
jgi:hypothetical protein